MSTPDEHPEPPSDITWGAWPVPRPRRPWRHTLRVAAFTVLAAAAAGIPFGLLWMLLAPDVRVLNTRSGVLPTDSQPEQFVAADGWFALLGVGFGVLAAIAGWLIARRDRGPVQLAAVVLGSLAAAAVGWQVGRLPGRAGFEQWQATAAAGALGTQPADLRAYGVLLVPAFTAVITYTLLAGWSHDPELGVHGDPEWAVAYPVSSDPTDGPVPTAAPESPVPGATTPPRG